MMYPTAIVLLVIGVAAAEDLRYSNEWVVKLEGGNEAADQLALKHGFMNLGQIGNLQGHYRLVLLDSNKTIEQLLQKTVSLNGERHVSLAEQQVARSRVKKVYSSPTDPKWNNQWSLKNTGQTYGPSGLDLNVEPVWQEGITGQGVLVGVVDDGLEWHHPDIYNNFDAGASYDFNNYDSDPSPDSTEDSHGTGCAGEIAMVKNNICGVGVAYHSNIASLKIGLGSDSSLTDSQEASALGHQHNYIDIYSNSWGPSDLGFIVDGPGTLVSSTFSTGTKFGRNGKGSIYVWAAGNGGNQYDSCAADGYVNSIYTIAVGSANQDGYQAYYDEDCTAKMAVTYSFNSDTWPSSESFWDPYQQIVTTDLNSGCTDGFTGTSASAPLLSATIALVLEANSELTWRDIQHLIVQTSDTTHLKGGTWTTNGAGFKVSSDFGFGAIDAHAMVTAAKTWKNVPDQSHYSLEPYLSGTVAHGKVISTHFTVSEFATSIEYLEHVVVTMTLSLTGYAIDYSYYDYAYYTIYDLYDLSHTRRGDIEVQLISPDGTVSTLLPYRKYDYINDVGYSNWPFMTVHHWGEDPVGVWQVKVYFKSTSGEVDIRIDAVDFYGYETAQTTTSTHAQTHGITTSTASHAQTHGITGSNGATTSYSTASHTQIHGTTTATSSSTASHNRNPTATTAPYDRNDNTSHDGSNISAVAIVASTVGVVVFIVSILVITAIGVVVCMRIKKKNSHTVTYSAVPQTPVSV